MELLTVSIADAAKSLGVSRSTTYSLLNAGHLHAIKIGRRTLITMESIRKLVTNAEVIGDTCSKAAA